VPFVRPPAPVPPTLAAAAVARLQGKGQVVSKPVQVEEIVVEEPPKAEPPKAFPPAASTSAPAARAAELPGTVALPPPMVPPPVAPVIPPPPQAVRPPTDGPMAPKVKPKLLNPGPEPTKAIPCRLFFDGRCEAGAMCPYAHMLDKVTGRAILVPPVGPDGKFIAEVVGKSGKVKKAAVDEETLKKKEVHREVAGETWVDPSLADWPENDHRLFVGNLGPDCTDADLVKAFSMYPSFAKARVVKDNRRIEKGKMRGYGFVSFLDPMDAARALKEMDGKYIAHRPISVTRSTWQDRIDDDAFKEKRDRDGHVNLAKMGKRQKKKHLTGLLAMEQELGAQGL